MKKEMTFDVDGDLPIDAMMLQVTHEKYKIPYAALRWAKEIKLKENLPDPVMHLIPRAIREILTNKVSLKDIEGLPMIVKIAPPPPPPQPTITLNPLPEEKGEEKTEGKEETKE